ncbi:toxin VasX [Cupriavidus sp. 30B13]|uniref:toxin VasX n=1 Tax=Cupriavidus sp. 30B13 TaxID=3384241 RepID=UPI003B91F30D
MTAATARCRRALQPPHPNAKRVGKAISPPPCEHGIPLYPLRYGVAGKVLDAAGKETPFIGEGLASLSLADYPALAGGKGYGLRVLRPRCYVYLCFFRDGRMWTRHYQVTDDIRFAHIWWTQADYDGDAPGRAARVDESRAVRYLLAPHDARDCTVFVLVSDTILTHAALWQIEKDEGGLRSMLATCIKAAQGAGQRHAFDAAWLTQVHELKPREQGKPSVFAWSETRPDAGECQSILDAMYVARMPRTDIVPLAVVVHDLAGMLSELNFLVNARLDELNSYSAEAGRKLRVSRLVDQLGAQASRHAELKTMQDDPVGSAMPPGVGGGAANAARDRAYKAGLAARARRLAFAREDERLRFERDHPAQRDRFVGQVTVAATDLWSVYQAQKARFDLIVATHDASDDTAALDLRCLVGQTLPGLIQCKPGNDHLAAQVTPDGPAGLLRYAIMGHPEMAKYVGKAAGQARRLAVDPMLKPLQELLGRLPPDGASQQLSLMIGALVSAGRLKSPHAYWTSVYRPIMEVLDGEIARLNEMPLDGVGEWLRKQTGQRGINGFRPQTAAQAAHTLIDVYDTQGVAAEQRAIGKLGGRLRFWHNARIGLSGVALFASAYSAGAAFKALGKEDGLTFAHALDAGGKLLGIGAGQAGLSRASYEKLRDQARLRGDTKVAEALDVTARSFERWAIGIAAGAAAVMVIKDGIVGAIVTEQGDTAAISAATGTLQAVIAGVGGLQLLGKLKPMAERLAHIQASPFAALRGAAAVARAGSGPIGWFLLAAEAIYMVGRSWHDRVADEARLTTWIARGSWGNRKNNAYFSTRPVPAFADDVEELREYYRLFLQPHIETDIAVLKVLGATTPMGQIIHGPGLPADARTITVALPGWRPQISHYKATQQHAADLKHPAGRMVTHEDPGQIKLVDGVGYLTITSDTVLGKTAVEYRPNGFTDPDFILTESNWL